MKQFNLEIILKRSKHCYKKPQPKLVKFSARVLASCATKQPPLGSILGTNGDAELLWPKKNLQGKMLRNKNNKYIENYNY